MGVLTRLRANLRLARLLYQRLRARGRGPLATILLAMPQAAAMRAYRKLASAVNDRILQRWVTPGRFRHFQTTVDSERGGHVYVLVMPGMLHFLLPCLQLVASDARVILLLNGASGWEADLLRARFPALPQFRVATLPGSSAGHGAMINLLLRNNHRDFGLLDHDLYLFDKTVWNKLHFGDNEFLLCLLSDTSTDRKWVYPLTHFLYFRVETFHRLMQQYGVGAESYRRIPAGARDRLAAIGLLDGETMKSHHDFFDTLHVLIALAYADGMDAAQIELATPDGVYHVGGTSIGTHHSKDLAYLYIHLRFLELAGEPLLQRRYAAVAAPFTSASALRSRVPVTPQTLRQMRVADAMIERLQQAAARDRRVQSV